MNRADSLTLTTQGIGFTQQNCVCFLKILTFHSLFQELINQYQTCQDLLECISHGDSKYGNEIQQILKKNTKFVKCLTCRLHSPAVQKVLKNVLTLLFSLTLSGLVDFGMVTRPFCKNVTWKKVQGKYYKVIW